MSGDFRSAAELPSPRVLRIIPELRADHVKRSSSLTTAETFYFGTNPDLPGTDVPSTFHRVSGWRALLEVAKSDADVLEIPEPLWVRFIPKNIAVTAVWKVAGIARQKNTTVITYAIENNSLENLIFGVNRKVRLATSAVGLLVGLAIHIGVDRICYGSEGARRAYSSIPFVSRVPSSVVLGLPAKSSQSARVQARPDARPTVVFAGVLEQRKGIEVLMQAWQAVEDQLAGAVLVLIGDGVLKESVVDWVKRRPANRIYLGRIPHSSVTDTIQRATVLVAPSIRDGRWREQIGLPIIEALTAGLTIVTSDETGLATWLSEQGHSVIPADRLASELADVLCDRLRVPLDPRAVADALPEISGRVEADQWLNLTPHQDIAPACEPVLEDDDEDRRKRSG